MINIEIMRLKPTKKGAILMAFIALVIGCLIGTLPGTQSQYASAEQDRHVLYFDKSKDIGVSLSENEFWNEHRTDGLKFTFEEFQNRKGLVNEKSVMISNAEGKDDCYLRVCMRIVDKDGNPIDPDGEDSRASKIVSYLWYDKAQNGVQAIPVQSDLGRNDVSFSRDQLNTLLSAGKIDRTFNSADFKAPTYNTELHAYVFNYNRLFQKNAQTTLFNRVVYPTDIDASDWDAVQGEYYIVVWAQAIQSEGFSDADSALSKLSNEYVPTELG